MAIRRIPLIIAVSAALLAAGGYGLYRATAQSAAPVLAQAPMNITNLITPAFIMAVDNSGSMVDDEALFRTANGDGRFQNNSFFDSSGLPYESGGTEVSKHMDQSGTYSDRFAALRSPKHNRAFFNPRTEYLPWRTATGGLEADSNIAAAVEDPRDNSGTTFDFSGTVRTTGNETWPSGSVVPAGTVVYNDETCDRAPGSTRTANAWVVYATEKTLASNCSINTRYYPARVYLDLDDPMPPGFIEANRVLVRGVGPRGADMWRYDYLESNFSTGGAAAVQNFANWWTYYGNRNRAMIAAMTHSLADVNRMRVGMFRINPPLPSGNVTMRDLGVQADRDALYADMRGLNASGNTPIRRATAYMIKQFRRRPTWADPNPPIRLQCQKNAGMLFTDGFTNDDNSGLTSYWNVGDTDYSQPRPYGGGLASTNTIADYAMAGYNTNPRPDLPTGEVPVPRACSGTPTPGTDCNTNLHVNFYGVTLGARGAIYDVNTAATTDPYTNHPSWTATGTMNLQPPNVDDIWHAALNARGEYINAQTPDAITTAMRRILGAVSDGGSPAGTIAVTGARIGNGSLSVQPRYDSTNSGTDWYSTLTAESISADPVTGEARFTTEWEAAAKLATNTSRNIRFGRTGSSVQPTVLDFTATNVTLANLCSDPLSFCTAAQISALRTGMDNTQAVAYLRGDRSLESGANNLRTRTNILGDIINSSPVLSSPNDDYGYTALSGFATSYQNYLTAKKAANRPTVLVGANDGMFHVFDGRTTSAGGNELFAYIPATSLGHMGNLLFPYRESYGDDQKFKHRYFVDGPVTVSDAYIGGEWKTIAVGTSGAGGRSVFALDITNPGNVSVLWEINNLITGNTGISNNIGHVLGKPVIVPHKTASGTVSWKVIFGNGYNSAGQQARLFVVDLASGAVTSILAAESTAPAFNGLGNVVVVDRRTVTTSTNLAIRDGFADTAYATDQNGAVWKFDLMTNTVALEGLPLFIARDAASTPNRQPIMGGLTAAAGPSGGVMLYFGTGSFSFEDDMNRNGTQTLYGILDRGEVVTGRSVLLQQTVGTTAGDFRATSNNAASTIGLRGWYLDLPARERFVGYPRIESGIVFFPTYVPSAGTGNDCAVDGDNYLYGLNALTGGASLTYLRLGSPDGTQPTATTGAVRLNAGSAPVKDVAVMTTPRVAPLAAGATAAEQASALASRCSMVVRVAGAPPMYVPRPCGRQSWRQVR